MPPAKRKPKAPAEEGTSNPVQAEAAITSSTVPATITPDGTDRPSPAGHPRDETAGGDGRPSGTAR